MSRFPALRFSPAALLGFLLSGMFLNLSAPLQAAPRIIFSNVRGNCCGGVTVAGTAFSAESLAEAFTPAVTDTLTGVRVVVFQVLGFGGDPHFNISLFSDANGVPGSLIEQIGTNVTANSQFSFATAQSILKPILRAGTQYWLVLTPANSSTEVGWRMGGSPTTTLALTNSITGQGGWRVISPQQPADLQFEIDGTIDIPCTVPIFPSTVVYVISGTRILEYDTSGNFIVQFGGTGSGPGQFQLPSGLTIDDYGTVFVADAVLNRIQGFDPCGNLLSRFGSTGTAPGLLYQPYGLAFDGASASDGDIWVADTGNNRIQAFNGYSGAFVTQFGSLGGGNGQFNAPVGISYSLNTLWVSDTGSNRIQQLNLTKPTFDTRTVTFNLAFGSYGNGNGQLRGPFGVVSDGTSVWVADSQNQRIEQFTAGGAFVRAIGPFSYPSPYGIAMTFGGVIWAVDYNTNTVTEFSPTGVILLRFGTTGGGPGQLYQPTYIAVGQSASLV